MNGAAPNTLAGALAEARASALGAAPAFDGEVTAAENGEHNQRLSTEKRSRNPSTPGPYFKIACLEFWTERVRRRLAFKQAASPTDTPLWEKRGVRNPVLANALRLA